MKRDERRPEDPFEFALLIWIAEEVEGAGVHGSQIFAIFVGAIRRGDDDDGDFRALPLGMLHNVAVRAVLNAKAAEARGNSAAIKKPFGGFGASDPLDIGPVSFENFSEAIAHLRIRAHNQQGRSFILAGCNWIASQNSFHLVRN